MLREEGRGLVHMQNSALGSGGTNMVPCSPMTPEFQQLARPRKAIPAEWFSIATRVSGYRTTEKVGEGQLATGDDVLGGNLPQKAEGAVQEKSFPCSSEGCGKVFSSAPGLREHERFHTGSAPYMCLEKNCSRSFKWRSSLAMHKKSHAFKAANGKRGRRKRKNTASSEVEGAKKMKTTMHRSQVEKSAERKDIEAKPKAFPAKVENDVEAPPKPVDDSPVECEGSELSGDALFGEILDSLPLNDCSAMGFAGMNVDVSDCGDDNLESLLERDVLFSRSSEDILNASVREPLFW
ncbi:hypothetical protein NDN08_003179 [Rhodosorus marinus]|uniref:C2H2-type domain-containing protein n=1 Tax=Rhodosorus marinus TaxID=101924 RepID=A0AAV8UVY4_9RHOD|nr:hypothetical protein NDN08_003179 [Rhodosorus marinus]